MKIRENYHHFIQNLTSVKKTAIEQIMSVCMYWCFLFLSKISLFRGRIHTQIATRNVKLMKGGVGFFH